MKAMVKVCDGKLPAAFNAVACFVWTSNGKYMPYYNILVKPYDRAVDPVMIRGGARVLLSENEARRNAILANIEASLKENGARRVVLMISDRPGESDESAVKILKAAEGVVKDHLAKHYVKEALGGEVSKLQIMLYLAKRDGLYKVSS